MTREGFRANHSSLFLTAMYYEPKNQGIDVSDARNDAAHHANGNFPYNRHNSPSFSSHLDLISLVDVP